MGEDRNVDQCGRVKSNEKGRIGEISNVHLSESADGVDVGHKSILPSIHVGLRPERLAERGDHLQRWREPREGSLQQKVGKMGPRICTWTLQVLEPRCEPFLSVKDSASPLSTSPSSTITSLFLWKYHNK